jgi:predicted nucleic acid-binding protein
MVLAVDSSVIVSVCLAGGRLGPLDGHELRAPSLLASEVTAAIREMSFRHEIPVEHAREVITYLRDVVIAYAPAGSLADDALRIAAELGWAKTYDAEYVALAQSAKAPLVTLDDRLARGVGRLISVLKPTDLVGGSSPEHV